MLFFWLRSLLFVNDHLRCGLFKRHLLSGAPQREPRFASPSAGCCLSNYDRARPSLFVLLVKSNNRIARHTQIIHAIQRVHQTVPGQVPEMTDNRFRLCCQRLRKRGSQHHVTAFVIALSEGWAYPLLDHPKQGIDYLLECQ
jgi:hypothetical protein